MNENEYININRVAEAKGLKSNRSLRLEINKPESKYIAREVKVNGGTSYEILYSSLEPEIQQKLREGNKKSTALVPLNYQPMTFVSESARLTSLARLDIVKALLNYRKRFSTKKEADSMFLDLYNSGMYLPKVFKFIGTISIGTLHRWVKSYERYENAECLIPQYKFNKQGEYNTILTDEMKHILLRFLLHQNKFNYGKAIKLTKEILRKQGYENLPCDLTFKRYAENFRKNNYAEWVLKREGMKAYHDKVEPYIERDISKIEVGDIIIADGHVLNFQVTNPFTGKPTRATLVGFLDWKSTALALIRKRIKDASNKNMVIGGKITTNINETYSGNKVMAAYGLQDRQNEYFKEKTWESFNINMSLYKRAGWMSPMMYLIASIGIAIVLGYGTYLINTGHMTAGSFASFVTSLLLLYKPVKTLGNTLTGIQNIFVAMGRVFELFDLEPKIKDSENAVELKGFDKEIKFENVCFEYIPNQPVLKNINLTIPKNETFAIVGNSGGGKSTLVNLLPRFYDIKSGAITIDGKDIKDFTIKSLRQNISMVFQDNFLYTGTIKDNIMMGNPDATTEELMSAIKSAHLEDMIQELPEGLETELGERGLTLSGGQRQRVAIARAMLRNAPIVILDEATSALDNESEAIVQKAMDNLMQNKTVFVIAHRLSTIKNANRIAVINEGELVELGTHEELMSIDNGEYKHLYEMQFRTQEEKV